MNKPQNDECSLLIKDAAIKSSINGIVLCDLDGNLTYVNDAFLRLMGYDSQEEVLGKPGISFVRGGKAGVLILKTLRRGDPWAGEVVVVRKDGLAMDVEVSAGIVRGAGGEPLCVMASFVDIMRRKKAEKELENYRKYLEKLVAERTAQLEAASDALRRQMADRENVEARLMQAQKMEAVGRLAGGIAHEFNNRLFAICNYAAVIRRLATDGGIAENAGKIAASCERAAKLVDELLRFSEGKGLSLRQIDLNEVIKSAEELLRVNAGKETVFKLELSPRSLPVMADVAQLEHVLINLVTNSREATPQGGSISVATGEAGAKDVPEGAFGKRSEKGRYAVVSISDTGLGMDARTRERIFEPFFTTKKVGEGAGLGLSVVYGIIAQHGGSIDVRSEPGKGATFRLFLPLL